ncbi:MAG: MarR family transcriptional regulator, partial [Planctomycetes bacterium]|nr:MarR family transcriptional regulator [Planctomycetota bacterium]
MNPTDFVGAFERITRAYQAARKIALGASGLSPEQLSVLSEANRRPGTPVEVIASALSMTASAATRAVKQLVRMGLLSSDEERVEPTEKGQAIGSRATEQVWSGFAQALGGAGAIA